MRVEPGFVYITKIGEFAYVDHENPYDGMMEGVIYPGDFGHEVKHSSWDSNGYSINEDQNLVEKVEFKE